VTPGEPNGATQHGGIVEPPEDVIPLSDHELEHAEGGATDDLWKWRTAAWQDDWPALS
jgi:hypothetical protein